jgi:hypothetical protein
VSATIQSINLKSSYGNPLIAYVAASDGSTFVEVNWMYKNISSKTIAPPKIDSSQNISISLVPEDGRKYEAHRAATAISFIDDGVLMQVVAPIAPGEIANRREVFEVPANLYNTEMWALVIKRGEVKHWFRLTQKVKQQSEQVPAEQKPDNAANSATLDVSEARMQLDRDRIALERERLELDRQKLEMGRKDLNAASPGKDPIPKELGERLDATVVSGWDLARVRYEINTIYARRGVEFPDKQIQAWADKQSWYQRVPGRNAAGAESLFTDSERFNIELLAAQRTRASGKEKSDQSGMGAWIFIDSSQRRLTKADLAGLNADQLWRARNEIYARNGLIFSTPRGRAFVGTLGDQYRGTDNSQEGVFGRMNEIEKANVEMIKKLE